MKETTLQKFFQLFHNIHDYTTLATRKNILLVYVFSILIYMAINFGLLGANFISQADIEANYYYPFHLLAFWSIFCFTLLEAFIMISSGIISVTNFIATALVFFNVISSLTTAILFSMSPKIYEVPCHYMEYTIQVFVSCVNSVFVFHYLRKSKGFFTKYKWLNHFRWFELLLSVPVILLSILQLFIFSGLIPVRIEPERAAHFCEYVNEILNASFALFYAVIMYIKLDKKMKTHYTNMYM